MDLNQMIARLDSLRAGDRERQDEGWRAWLQGLAPEEAQAVQSKIEAFSREELHITWRDWDEALVNLDTISRAPKPLLYISEAIKAYVLALYQASLAKDGLRAILDDLPGCSKS